MSPGINIRLALVYLAVTGMVVHCTEPQKTQNVEAPDTAEEPMELPPSGEWMSGSNEVRSVSNNPAPRSHSPSRKRIIRRYTYSSVSRVPFTPAVIRKTSYSPLTDNIDPGPVTVVGSSHRPVKSQFGYRGSDKVQPRAAREGKSARLTTVSESVSIMRKQGDRQKPFSVVSSPAIKFVAGNQHRGQASPCVKPTCKPDVGEDTTTVSKSIASRRFKKPFRGGVRYLVIKPHRRLNGVTHPPSSLHKGQGRYSSNLVSSSPSAQNGKVNSPVESKGGQVAQSNNGKVQSVSRRGGHGAEETTQAGYRGHSKNVGPQMVAKPDGLFDQHRSTGDIRKTIWVTSSRNFSEPISSIRVWTQREAVSTADVNPTVNPVPAKVLNQATKVNKVGMMHKNQNKDKNPEPQSQFNPQRSSSSSNNNNNSSSSSSSAKPGQNTNVKISTVAHSSGQNQIPLTSSEVSKSAFQTSLGKISSGVLQSAPRQPEHTSMQHQSTESQAQNQSSPDTNTGHYYERLSVRKGVLKGKKNSRYPESHLPTILEQRYQNINASNAALRGRLSQGHVGPIQSSGQRGKSHKSGIITGNADFSTKFGSQTTVNSQRGHIVSQGVRKVTRIQTRFGYMDVPLAATTFSRSFGTDRGSLGYFSGDVMLTPAVLKKLSQMARLTQTQSSTSTHGIGTQVKSSSSSKKRKTLTKFKPVSLADIGGSVAFRSKRTWSAPESIGLAALHDPVNISTLQSTSQFPIQLKTSDAKRVDESSSIYQKPNSLNAQEERHQGSSDGQHPKQSQKVVQGSSQDIINFYGRFSPRSGSEDDGRSQD